MRAAILRAPGDLGVETVPDPVVEQPTDAVVRVVALDAVAAGYEAMRDREATKVLVRP